MRKKTRALSGASQEAFFRRVLRAHPGLSPEERDALLRKLRSEVAQVRVRVEPRAEAEVPHVIGKPAPSPDSPAEDIRTVAPTPAPVVAPFDPFSPNVVVVVRKEGRKAALAALGSIDSIDDLRLLAREQRLSIGDEPVTAADVRAAIVTAAERRIANRMAAAT